MNLKYIYLCIPYFTGKEVQSKLSGCNCRVEQNQDQLLVKIEGAVGHWRSEIVRAAAGRCVGEQHLSHSSAPRGRAESEVPMRAAGRCLLYNINRMLARSRARCLCVSFHCVSFRIAHLRQLQL